MFSQLLDLVSASPWTYAVILAVAALDAVFPLVPSEATVISAGVLAGLGELSIALVIAAGAAGALTGDSSAYVIGRVTGRRFESRFARSPRAKRRLAWAASALARRGGLLIFGGRFVPGGRTAVTITAGLTRMRAPLFAGFAALAATAWASYAGLLGYLGGRSFETHPELAFVLGFGLAVAVIVVVEAARRLRRAEKL
jgi:membrane-associated protein